MFNDMIKVLKLKGIFGELFKLYINLEIIFCWVLVFFNVCEDVNIENILVYLVGLIFLLFYEDGIMGKICKLDLMYLF